MRTISLCLSFLLYACAGNADAGDTNNAYHQPGGGTAGLSNVGEYTISLGVEEPEYYFPSEVSVEATEVSTQDISDPSWEDLSWHERYILDNCAKCPDCCVTTMCCGGDEADDCLEVAGEIVEERFSEHCKIQPPENFDSLILQAAGEYDINPKALALTVYRESKCSQKAFGKVGEIGLTQIYPRVWLETLKKELGISSKEDLWKPLTNLRAAAYILWRCNKRSRGDTQEAFRIYNGSGEGARRYARHQMRSYRRIWRERPWL
jgi:hypothetical protein